MRITVVTFYGKVPGNPRHFPSLKHAKDYAWHRVMAHAHITADAALRAAETIMAWEPGIAPEDWHLDTAMNRSVARPEVLRLRVD